MMATHELTVAEVKRALDVAREAMERDAEESRLRGRAVASPDFSSVGMLAAGILVANAIGGQRAEDAEPVVAPTIRRTRSSRVAARS
jgi:hypothetical protein